ncbi:hypothetical protein TNCT_102301 [Trichonephila clavata]|uniref:Uncharacterized protein n=1 Tax=Trichonephila clavata TaxID=2740835 RepID=A0A8X6I0M5_TRICU|nr:hypothetical protein TNCT_102301 [Trichonephila clavata]
MLILQMLYAKPPTRRCHRPAVLSAKPRMSVSARQKDAYARIVCPGPTPASTPAAVYQAFASADPSDRGHRGSTLPFASG